MLDEAVSWPPPGRYIVAVSGGADSMALLALMAAAPAGHGYELVVAHFDHGMRADSPADAGFVAAAAADLHLPYVTSAANLGRTSEATARAARHTWLEQVRSDGGAQAILTAHHQDDLLETSLLNLARGSGRRGLAPMSENPQGAASGGLILRPLLGVSRAQLRDYAAAVGMHWREDPSNADQSNPRNFLRHRLLPAAPPGWREAYLQNIDRLAGLNAQIAHELEALLEPARQDGSFAFDRAVFRALGPAEAGELLLAAARELRPGIQLDRRLLQQAATIALAGNTGNQRPLRQGLELMLTRSQILLTTKTPQ